MSLSVNTNDLYNSGLESEGVLSTSSGSSNIKVHFYERPPENVLKNFDVSGKQPVVFVKQTDAAEVQLNVSTSTLTVNSVTYRFVKRHIHNQYSYMFELGK